MVTFKYFWVILLMNVANSKSEKYNINSLVDSLIQNAKESILSKNNGQINIPDMEEHFRKKVAFMSVSGGVKATEGIFKNLATLQRTGEATLNLNEKVAKLRLPLGLKDMEIYFNHCRVWVGKIFSMSQTLQVTVGTNSIDGQISVFDDGESCKATLDHITINELKDLDVKIKVKGGPDFLNGILGNLGNWVVNHIRKNIKEAAEKELKEQVSKEMQKHNLCDIFN